MKSVLRELANLLKSTNKDSAPCVHRSSLKSIPRHMISYDSYGDIWGESTPPQSPKSERQTIEKTPSEMGDADSVAVLVPFNASTDTLGDLDIPPGAPEDGTPGKLPSQRWEATAKPGAVSDGGDDGTGKTAEGDTTPVSPKKMGSIQREGDDSVPVVPNRRSSVMAGAKRQQSFDYSELSMKGLSIDMAKEGDQQEVNEETGTSRRQRRPKGIGGRGEAQSLD